ncbi:uncharacterized protein LOC121371583 isoform X3 [Gigantopelta aegis]|uniref:uncharacterized protein LOC121371583 isoform X3 n=1 Tax=Gigantopelta aegis TaxID=1735272 RepID=UPI001B88CACE|nr:uncharacterized protein LOC121371583 isoform X3 [Gigantopelta aegis]
MRIVLVLLVLVVVATFGVDSFRLRGRRFWRRVKRAATAIAAGGKRDVADIDINMDGVVDQAEVENYFGTRDARDLLRLANTDGNNEVAVDEFQQALQK